MPPVATTLYPFVPSGADFERALARDSTIGSNPVPRWRSGLVLVYFSVSSASNSSSVMTFTPSC